MFDFESPELEAAHQPYDVGPHCPLRPPGAARAVAAQRIVVLIE